ncbi:MAG: DUF4114 domain-containing protein [Cyanobacteriota bacterium]
MAIPPLPLLSIETISEGCSANPDGSGGQPLRFVIRRSDAEGSGLQNALGVQLGLFAGPLASVINAPALQELSFAPGEDSLTLTIPLLAGATPPPGASLLVWLLPQANAQLQPGAQSASGGFDSPELINATLPQPSPWKRDRETINPHAFAALRADGSVLAWGDPDLGGDSSAVEAQLSSGVVQIFSTNAAFAALRLDGSVVAWGDAESGANTSPVGAQLLRGVRNISTTEAAFAALKADGSVVAWGDAHYGGNSQPLAMDLASGVVTIASTASAFAALKADGSVITWGDSVWGGDSSLVAEALRDGVVQLFANGTAFAALRRDGTVISWGDSVTGGDSSAVAGELNAVDRIASNDVAFAALRTDGSVITWGDPAAGGDSSDVSEELRSGVIRVVGSERAFAALKADGSVICWGDLLAGGEPLIGLGLNGDALASGVVDLSATAGGFVALKSDGSALCWGHPLYGGAFNSPVKDALSSGVLRVVSNGSAFAAIRSDGSVVCWGDPRHGGLGPLEELVPGSGLWEVPVLALADPFSDERRDRAPTSLTLSGDRVLERMAAGTTVAWLEGLDPDLGDSLSFTLVTGDGDRDNALFMISGQRLQQRGSLDHEIQTSARIRLAATDPWGRRFERAVTLNLRDAPGEQRILLQGSDDAHEVLLEDLATLGLQEPAGQRPRSEQTSLAEIGIRVVLERRLEDLRDGVTLRLPWELMALGLRSLGGDGTTLGAAEHPLVFSYDPAQETTKPLGYDPITSSGARFLDQNGDGQPDAIVLSLRDGGGADRDGSVNGQIRAALVLASGSGRNPTLAIRDNTVSLRSSGSSEESGSAPVVPIQLRVRLTSRSKGVGHIGMVVLQAGETLVDLSPEVLDQRSRRLLSSLAATDGLPLGESGSCSLTLLSDQSLGLFEEADGSDLSSSGTSSNRRWLRLSPVAPEATAGQEGQQLWARGSQGLQVELSLQEKAWLGLGDLVASEQGLAPLLDFTALADQTQTVSVRVLRDAARSTTAGFYRILDRQGTVRDPISGALLRPGDRGYGDAALAAAVRGGPLDDLRTAQQQVSVRQGSVLEGGLLAPYAQVAGDGTYFGFAAANPDRIEHMLRLGANVFGFEDLRGGGDRDFNDLVISLALQPQPVG